MQRILLATGSQATLDDPTLTTGVPFQGNRLIRSATVTLRDTAPPPPPRSLLTRAMQLPWKLVFKRLESSTHKLTAERQPAPAERANA